MGRKGLFSSCVAGNEGTRAQGSCTLDKGFRTALLLQARASSSHYHHTQTILNGITNNNVFLPVGKLIHAFKLGLNFVSQ